MWDLKGLKKVRGIARESIIRPSFTIRPQSMVLTFRRASALTPSTPTPSTPTSLITEPTLITPISSEGYSSFNSSSDVRRSTPICFSREINCKQSRLLLVIRRLKQVGFKMRWKLQNHHSHAQPNCRSRTVYNRVMKTQYLASTVVNMRESLWQKHSGEGP